MRMRDGGKSPSRVPASSSSSFKTAPLNWTMPKDFEKQSYWKGRFSTETSFEWLVSSDTFVSILEPHLARLEKTARILQLGSGTSDLQNHLRARGFCDVTNVDYEPLAMDRGRDIEKKAFGDVVTKYVVADATQLGQVEGLSGKFDLVVDKSTADAISCGEGPGLLRMAAGIRERLVEGGVWISFSLSSSRFNSGQLPFQVEVMAKVPTPKLKPTDPDIFYWCYLLRPT